MEMEGMFSRIIVVKDNFDDLVLAEHEGVCGAAVDGRVRGVWAG